MEVLSYNLDVKNIVPIDGAYFDAEAQYLWVLHADKVPPHIGISSEGKYFSLKSNGKDNGIRIDIVRQIVDRKGISTLLFKLNRNISATEIETSFDAFERTVSNEITCLNPLKKLLDYPDARMLRDLLAELEADNLISEVRGINISSSFKGIQNYSVDAIHGRLRKLENA